MVPMKLMGRAVCAVVVCLGFVTGANGDYSAADFFPLEGSPQRTYHFWGNGGEGLPFDVILTVRVEEQQVTIGAYDTWELATWTDGVKGDSIFYSVDGGGVYSVREPDRNYATPLVYLPALLAVGQTTTDTVDVSWIWEDGTVITGESERSITPVGLETITVPAGTYSALRVDWAGTSTGYWTDGVEWKEVNDHTGSVWYVEGLGLVKRTEVGSEANYWRDGGDWVQGQTDFQDHTMELVPEPATLSLLAMGGLALLRRRRTA